MNRVVCAVGSPERLVEYERLPGCFVHPVPILQEIRVCFAYRKKLKLLCLGLNEMRHYIMVHNGRNLGVYEATLNLQCLAESLLKTLLRMCKYHKQMSRRLLRKYTITVVNHFKTITFRVHRLIFKCRKVLNKCRMPFPVRTC